VTISARWADFVRKLVIPAGHRETFWKRNVRQGLAAGPRALEASAIVLIDFAKLIAERCPCAAVMDLIAARLMLPPASMGRIIDSEAPLRAHQAQSRRSTTPTPDDPDRLDPLLWSHRRPGFTMSSIA
jgi:tryptophan halogenase